MGQTDTIEAGIAHLHESSVEAMAGVGTWWTGVQRCEIIAEARAARTHPLDLARKTAVTPNAVEGSHEATEHLPAAAVEATHRISTDPGRLTRSWADEIMADIGEEAYVELVALVSSISTIDSFARCLGTEEIPLPPGGMGEPSRQRPDGMGDTGAWVAQTNVGVVRANVARATSLVPEADAIWRDLVDQHYSRGSDFVALVWDRALSRPQVEAIASAVSEVNECFY